MSDQSQRQLAIQRNHPDIIAKLTGEPVNPDSVIVRQGGWGPIVPFNYSWDMHSGIESISCLVTEDFAEQFATLSQRPYHEGDLKDFACHLLGRDFDLVRCTKVKIEVKFDYVVLTASFSPPWYEAVLMRQMHTAFETMGDVPPTEDINVH